MELPVWSGNNFTTSAYVLPTSKHVFMNENLISQAIKKLQANKRDALFDTISDCYINGPSNLKTHIKNLVRIFIIHGSVPNFILACILTPLVKDGLGDITNSDNYRAIAGGCLLLKILDIVILLLEGDKLKFAELQFAYQSKSSTTMRLVCYRHGHVKRF